MVILLLLVDLVLELIGSGDVLTVSGVDAFIRVDRSNNNPGIDLRYQGSSTNREDDVTTTGDLRFATGGRQLDSYNFNRNSNLQDRTC